MLLIRNILYAVNLALVLLLAVVCTNVATLGFARTATRGREITVLATIVGLVAATVALRFGVGQLAASDALPFWIDDSLSVATISTPGCLPSLEPRVSASCRRFA